MTDRLDPDDSKASFDEPTRALGSAPGPEDGPVLQYQRALFVGSNFQSELLLQGDGYTGLRIVRILRADGVHFDDMPRVQLEVQPGVAILLQHGMLIPGRDGCQNITTYREITYFQVFAWIMWLFWGIFHRLFPFHPEHVLVVLGRDYEVFPPNPDVNYSVA